MGAILFKIKNILHVVHSIEWHKLRFWPILSCPNGMSRLAGHCSWIVAISVVLTVAGIAQGADFTVKDVSEVSQLLQDEKTANLGVGGLNRILASDDKAVAYMARARLAAYFRGHGNLDKAAILTKEFQQTAGYTDLHPSVAIAYLQCLLEATHVLVLQDKVTEALPLLNWAETRPREYDRAVACTKYAQILEDIKEVDRAEAYCQKALSLCEKQLKDNRASGAAIGQGSADVDTASAWYGLRHRIELIQAGIQSQKMERRFGKEFGQYVLMRMCMAIGQYKKAIEAGKQLAESSPDSLLAAAAGYGIGVCILNDESESDKNTRIKNAVQWLQGFIKQAPDGLYRGEAMMLIGEVAMKELWNPKVALEFYTNALNYFVVAREKANALSLYAPLGKELENFACPTERLTTYNTWYRIVRNEQNPVKLYNAASAPPWYRSEQEKECHLAVGFLQFNAGNYEEAKSHWSVLRSLDEGLQAMPSHIPNIQRRLEAVCDQKFIALSSEEKSVVKDASTRLKITYAEYLYFIEKFDEAIEIYDSVAKETDALPVKALMDLARGMAIDMGGGKLTGVAQKKAAAEYFERVIKHGEKNVGTPIMASAMFSYATSLIGTQYGKEDAVKLYSKILNDEKYFKALRHDYRSRALWGLVQCYLHFKKFDLADDAVKAYYKKNEKDKYYPTLTRQVSNSRE